MMAFFRIPTFLLLTLLPGLAWANAWPTLNITELLKSTPLISHAITIQHDPVYQAEKQYSAYALKEILDVLGQNYPGEKQKAVLIFTASDGYQSTLPYPDAVKEKGYVAYQDIDAEQSQWLPFARGKKQKTPAPFYLVWQNPGLSEWQYPWPYQLTHISMQPTTSYYSAIAPTQASAQHQNGFELITRYCLRCHKIKDTGGNVGPAFDQPVHVTARYDTDMLNTIILDAPSVFSSTKMPAFNSILSTEDVQDILLYMKLLEEY